MKIAIVALGSLIRDPGKLTLDGTWQCGGPVLPIEFSRVSEDRRLTLVIDRDHGQSVTTYFATSGRMSLPEAVEELRTRERTPTLRRIGYVEVESRHFNARCDLDRQAILAWSEERGFDATIWADLGSNFEERVGQPFTLDAAVAYLRGLDEPTKDRARQYVLTAPRETDTPLQRRLKEIGWL